MNKITKFIITILSLFNFSCKKEIDDRLKVGQKYEGGIIFYIDGTGNHGLIAAEQPNRTRQILLSGIMEVILK